MRVLTRAYYRGKPVDQLQMHVIGDHVTTSPSESFTMENNEGGVFANDIGTSMRLDEGKSYHVITASFDEDGNLMEPEGVISDYDTGSPFPTFAIIKPAIPNTRVEASPYGQSVFADAIDAVQSVDLAFDALVNEVSAGKMRIFLSDVMFDHDKNNGKNAPIPFGKGDCTIFRKVMSTEDVVQEFAPALRTSSQAETFRTALQMLGDLCGFGLTYYDFDSSGYVKTATEVSSDNSALMRNIRKHENALTRSLATISHALLWCARSFGEALPAEGVVTVQYDDSIVTDTSAEKAQDMAEVAAGLMGAYEYRMRWYSEDEATARKRAGELSRPVAGSKRLRGRQRARRTASGPAGRLAGRLRRIWHRCRWWSGCVRVRSRSTASELIARRLCRPVGGCWHAMARQPENGSTTHPAEPLTAGARRAGWRRGVCGAGSPRQRQRRGVPATTDRAAQNTFKRCKHETPSRGNRFQPLR